jgi:hypothetical protein
MVTGVEQQSYSGYHQAENSLVTDMSRPAQAPMERRLSPGLRNGHQAEIGR